MSAADLLRVRMFLRLGYSAERTQEIVLGNDDPTIAMQIRFLKRVMP